ncbi:MAG: hypothetical protein WC728_12085 [Elusimicrobiota bacterium]
MNKSSSIRAARRRERKHDPRPALIRRKRAIGHAEERRIDSLMTALRPLLQRLAETKKRAAKLGVFAEERELLACPKCGLEEDVAMGGFLLVTSPADRHHDTGLRFKMVKRRPGFWRCPACGAEFQEPSPKAV